MTQYELGDTHGAVDDYTRLIDTKDTPPPIRAAAHYQRGLHKAKSADHEGALADYSAAVETEEVPIGVRFWALNNRAEEKATLGDLAGALTDLNMLIDSKEAPTEEVARALLNRAVLESQMGDHLDVVNDTTRLMETPGTTREQLTRASMLRALAYDASGNHEQAVRDFIEFAKNPGESDLFYSTATGLAMFSYSRGERGKWDDWLLHLVELEPMTFPFEERLRGRVWLVTDIAANCSIDDATRALDFLQGKAEPELSRALEFLRPALELARTGSEAPLRELPPEEQRIARRIAETILERRKKVGDGVTASAFPEAIACAK
jgi:tetratricopeptide (TPR) repeat protein